MTAKLTQNPDRVLLKNISWQTYQSLVKDFEQQPAIRLTYDQGLLEIRMPLDPHETYKKLLGRLVEALTEELGVEIRSLGSRTCDREDLARGLEPDQCYYIQNEQAVWDKEQIDLKQDPPPDLAIEIDEVRGSPVVARRGLSDITSSSINRLDIYRDLGVPEIWRYDGQSLTMYYLDKQYQPCSRSIAFPLLTPNEKLEASDHPFGAADIKPLKISQFWQETSAPHLLKLSHGIFLPHLDQESLHCLIEYKPHSIYEVRGSPVVARRGLSDLEHHLKSHTQVSSHRCY